MYKQWLDNAISNESIMVLVAILNNSIQGFVTVHQQALHKDPAYTRVMTV